MWKDKKSWLWISEMVILNVVPKNYKNWLEKCQTSTYIEIM